MRSSLRFNKFTTAKTIEFGLWTLQAPRQLLNIANIQSRSWSAAEFAQVAKQEEEVDKINPKVHQKDILEAVVLPWAQNHFGNANWTFQQDCTSSKE
ncbi:hypothetical protein TNCV_2709021 [Trichonephila clavipes]|nr:hypothetical protein TNCV_2709021 [Trichonephila clavipes]